MTRVPYDSPAIQGYLGILQSVINRMASNSSGCKTWCITIVAAMVVFILEKAKPDYIWIAMTLMFIFFLLDSYYLGLERHFRGTYNDIVQKIYSDNVTVNDLYALIPPKYYISSTLKASLSISVWPFYGLIAIMLLIIRIYISCK